MQICSSPFKPDVVLPNTKMNSAVELCLDASMLNVCLNKAEVNGTSVHKYLVRLLKTSLGI